MGLFGDLDVAAADDNPWAVPANTYEADVYLVEVKKDRNENKGLSIIYKITSGDHRGKTVSEWKIIPNPADPENLTPEERQAASYIKMRLASLGVPESRMNDVNVNDLMGLAVTIKVTVNGDYTNVARVELREGTAFQPQEFTGFGA
jgi:hypothetical protein